MAPFLDDKKVSFYHIFVNLCKNKNEAYKVENLFQLDEICPNKSHQIYKNIVLDLIYENESFQLNMVLNLKYNLHRYNVTRVQVPSATVSMKKGVNCLH